MWLISSSIGRKFVMAVTGACLVLFVTFHCLMNGVALFWPEGYNAVCEFLGANWYALVATVGLAALFIIHIIYATWLTLQNRRARGADRYAVQGAAPGVEWSSKNMLVLGIVILAFLVVHMIQFWAKMQLAEILDCEYVHDGVEVAPAAGTLFIQIAFSQVYTPIVYIIGFVALWFHMNHGMWSMMQTVGWDGDTWMPRLKKISLWWTTIVVGLFIAEAIVFTVRAHRDDFAKQYTEYVEYKSAQGLLSTDVFNGGEPFAKPCNAACGNPCNEACQPACGNPCNEACQPACGNPCNEACQPACGNPCNEACQPACGNPCNEACLNEAQ